MKRFLLLFMAIILITGGCKYSSEPDEKAYVTAIGVDKGEKYDLRFTFIFTTPQSEKSDSEGGSGEQDETVVIEAPSLYSAMDQMNSFKSKTVELTHTQTVVFSEELAKEGIKEYIYMLVRSDNFRPNIYICIADKSSMEFLEKIKPVQTSHLEKYFQLIFKKLNSGSYGEMYLYDIYFDMLSENKASILPYCAINVQQIEESAENPTETPSEASSESEENPTEESGHFASNTDDFAVNIVAGNTVRKNENPAEIQGAAVIKDGVYLSVLGRIENMIVQMINDKFPDSYITVSNPYDPDKMITVFISQKNDTKVTVDTADSPKISVSADLEGDFISLGEDDTFLRDPSLFEAYFKEKMEKEVMKLLEKTARELDCDICSFFKTAKKSFMTIEDWNGYDWINRYRDAEFDVEINLTMRTYGELSQNV